MKVLIVASEGAPYIKTGGLADVIGALPKALKANGVDVRVILPYYKKIKEKNLAWYKGYCYVTMGSNSEYAGIYHAIEDGIDYYFIDSDKYFSQDKIYGFDNDGERFAFFDFAVLEALKVIDWFPNVIHCNDWQTGLIPYLVKCNYWNDWRMNSMKSVYSIHNIQYQGIFPKDMLQILNMPYSSSFEFDNCINFMKAGIMEANAVTTVSPTYKDEVLTDYYGYKLNNILGMRYFDFHGILNGIDVDKYDPATDKNIPCNYDINSVYQNKPICKAELLKSFGMNPNDDVPVFGLVSRLAEQKGIELFMPIMDQIINTSNAKFIFMGSGDAVYENYFRDLEGRYPDRFKCFIGYSDSVAQRIYAGSDIFIMPSKFEPCGLGQIIAMRYGTLPLVRETGGLKDTVKPYNQFESEGSGTGFTFANFDYDSLNSVIHLAIDVYNYNRQGFNHMIYEAMRQDFSWDQSAKVYLDLFERISR